MTSGQKKNSRSILLDAESVGSFFLALLMRVKSCKHALAPGLHDLSRFGALQDTSLQK